MKQLLKGWLVYVLLLMVGENKLLAQKRPPCSDPLAIKNLDTLTIDSENCKYPITNAAPNKLCKLPATLHELSGLVYWNGYLWGHNDSGNPAFLYKINEATGDILQVFTWKGAKNVDWEEITQDETHFYIGDFGNNASGIRKDLTIYKLPKIALSEDGDTVVIPNESIENIQFAYSDQVSFDRNGSVPTRFDAEAMVHFGGKIHLFSKNWLGGACYHYIFFDTGGNHIAQLIDSLPTDGMLITGASITNGATLALVGYSKKGQCDLLLLFAKNNPSLNFNAFNIRKIKLPFVLTSGQLEAVCWKSPFTLLLGNELFKGAGLPVNPKIASLDAGQWLLPYFTQNERL